MSQPTPQQLLDSLNWRYATKRFDPLRRLDAETWNALEQSLILTPSSYGLQPWRFYIITDETVKAKLPSISWNQKQPQDCSHMVVLAARKTMDAEYVDTYMKSVIETRELPGEAVEGYRRILVSTIEKMETHLDWNCRQVYIALGQLMVAAALLGVDTCPMEGIAFSEYDKLLGIEDSEFTTVVGCAVGYRHAEDTQADAKKVRFSASDLVVHV
ncbi:NAD(P)H-dependent oxidoreductase [Aureliella helgolandensis]|uniref:NAD(P)H nitroreductase YfkO n=1 Tax=Aureliella helgolandensis TaxID=2527968 RepID=A0A518GEQ8_9BACT|nr:NAD(P)H-dependent oxidoreductase [Aureliella helgolandensis]QDV27084.1 Putative NAD(P)H nitroreductase YfkO [Aureliella helgolandensis]